MNFQETWEFWTFEVGWGGGVAEDLCPSWFFLDATHSWVRNWPQGTELFFTSSSSLFDWIINNFVSISLSLVCQLLAVKLGTRDRQPYRMQRAEALSIGKPEVGQTCSEVAPPARPPAARPVQFCKGWPQAKPANGLTRPFLYRRPSDFGLLMYSSLHFLMCNFYLSKSPESVI